MILLSAAAYDVSNPQECLDNAMKDSKFQILGAFTRKCGPMKLDRCSAYVAISDTEKAIIVAFRGSEDYYQVRDEILSVLGTPKTTFLPGLKGKVQVYWRNAYNDLWSCMKSYVTSARKDHAEYNIWVTGHSLGGAMASLASTQIVQDGIAPAKLVVMYTFGMPRVGNYKYALEHDKLVRNSWRVVQYGDPVVHFPTILTPFVLGGPYHHGIEAYYKDGAKNPQSAYKECHRKPFNEDRSCSFTDSPLHFKPERHTSYFSIPVGTFWKKRCVTRAKRDINQHLNATFQFFSDRCSVYTFPREVPKVETSTFSSHQVMPIYSTPGGEKEGESGKDAVSVPSYSTPVEGMEDESGHNVGSVSSYLSYEEGKEEESGEDADRSSLRAGLIVFSTLAATVGLTVIIVYFLKKRKSEYPPLLALELSANTEKEV